MSAGSWGGQRVCNVYAKEEKDKNKRQPRGMVYSATDCGFQMPFSNKRNQASGGNGCMQGWGRKKTR